jgi:SAM-dependent methyltransferase
MKYSINSKIMIFFRKIGLASVAWSFRRLYVPVNKDALVLEVGSGGNPYFRSNVLIDAFLNTRERHYEKLVTDRPMVLGFVENLPFKDNSFDFVIASNVLEHSWEPEKFISELQRVAKAGYIEVPDAFFERLTCYRDHKLEITDKNCILEIRKKSNYIHDKEVYDLFNNKVSKIFQKINKVDPFKFAVTYYWSKDNGGIKYKIINPEYEFDWTPPEEPNGGLIRSISLIAKIKRIILKLVRKFLSQNNRNKNISLDSLIICPKCKNNNFIKNDTQSISCNDCNIEYTIIGNKIIKFN